MEFRIIANDLSSNRIYLRYMALINNIYKNATFQVALHELTYHISIKRGMRQGDGIFGNT